MSNPAAAATHTAATPTANVAPTVSLQRQCDCGNHAMNGECDDCKMKQMTLQRYFNGAVGPSAAPPIVHDVLRSAGQPLDETTRAFMERRLGHDFSSVRVHTDGRAAESAHAVHALAYTVGHNVVFAPGRFSPAARAGKTLIAHELAHTVQQAAIPRMETLPARALRLNEPHDSLEQEADRAAESVLTPANDVGVELHPSMRSAAADHWATLQRQPDPAAQSPLDDPTRYETIHEKLFVSTPGSGGGSVPQWNQAAEDSVEKQFKDWIVAEKKNNPKAFETNLETQTDKSDAETDIVKMDKVVRARFPQISKQLSESELKSRVGVLTAADTSDDDFLRQWLSNQLNGRTDVGKYGLNEKDTRYQKVLTDLLKDPEAGPLIRIKASLTASFTTGSGSSRKVSVHRALPPWQRQIVLIHELVHFYVHDLFVEWLNETTDARFYDEGFAEYLGRKAMTPDQLSKAKSYDKQTAAVEKDVAATIPEDDIARAFFLGEVWRIEGKSKVAKKAFKEQTGLDPEAKRKEEHEQSREVAGIVEIVAPGERYRFMNLGNEAAEPKQEHIDSFRQIYKQFIENDPTARIRFVGHASSPGTLVFNKALSLQRSKAFYQMARDAGVPEDQLFDAKNPPHFGETKPTAGNEDVRGRAFNRRVELFITHVAAGSGTQPQTQPQPNSPSQEPDYLQRAADGPEPVATIPAIVHEVLRSPGQPLDAATRAFMEPRFGRDFSSVRLHTDAHAAESARAVNARAYTVGEDIVFSSGRFAPFALEGRKLLVHELAHVVQNGGERRNSGFLKETSYPADASEREASGAAERMLNGDQIEITESPDAVMHRDTEDVLKGIGIGAAVVGGLTAVGFGIAALAGAFKKKSPAQQPASLDDPTFRKKWEAALQEGLAKLEALKPKGGCKFPRRDEMRFDQDNWEDASDNRERLMGVISLRPKMAKPYDAVRLLFERLDKWTCDCRMFGEVSLLYVWWAALKDDPDQFNKKFAGLKLSAESTTGIERTVNVSEDDVSWKNAPVGTKVAWENSSPAAKPPWTFEHAIKSYQGKPGEDDLYAAHPLGYRLNEDEVKEGLAKNSADYPWIYEVTDLSLSALRSEGVPDDVLKNLETIKNNPFTGQMPFLDQPPLMDLRQKARQDPPRFSELINTILQHTRRDPNPADKAKYIKDNIHRSKLEIMK